MTKKIDVKYKINSRKFMDFDFDYSFYMYSLIK